jgi:undecaprenyl-phosphate galactose phosphotransferase
VNESVFTLYSIENITFSCYIKEQIYFGIKRFFDILLSLIGLLGMTLVAFPIKIMYILTGDFKSIFYTHVRVGKDGKQFYMYKFRTMVPNAKEMLEEMLKDPKYKKEWDENQKIENDPRITKAGKILRKTSLDEIPQMLNIFLNDMSLIGPRPLVPGELDKHNGNHDIYEKMKPGVTSWWASHGRSATTYEKRLELEYYYVQNCSLLLDIKCIFATIGAVISKTGAK